MVSQYFVCITFTLYYTFIIYHWISSWICFEGKISFRLFDLKLIENAVYRVQYTVYSVQYQCTVYSEQYQCTVSSIHAFLPLLSSLRAQQSLWQQRPSWGSWGELSSRPAFSDRSWEIFWKFKQYVKCQNSLKEILIRIERRLSLEVQDEMYRREKY